jgi:cyclic GMP-AMP synthase DncV-like protein
MILDKVILRKVQQVGLLERICQALELTETQYKEAKAHYEAVGKWLSDAESSVLRGAIIYPQGSVSYGTTVRPVRQQEYDLDLVCFLPGLTHLTDAGLVKKLVGDRLKEHSVYENILDEEKLRCWRLKYANSFHLDITPSIPNPACLLGGELVPDRQLKEWKPTNPKGYSDWFDNHAKLQPRISFMEGGLSLFKANIEELPEPTKFKGLLKRCVQLCKRHRDLVFLDQNKEIAPISIVITTLTAKAYKFCVTNFLYETELDVLLDILRRMPDFIETHDREGQQGYYIWNETTQDENFAEKWNADSRLPKAFYSWREKALGVLERITKVGGMDELYKELSPAFGEEILTKAMGGLTAAVSSARAGNFLAASPHLGLTTFNTQKNVKVRPNTFYGA